MIKTKPYEHPWIDDQCRRLLSRKHAAVGTPDFAAARDACSAGFTEAQRRYLVKTKETLRTASAKDWWKFSKDLMSKAGGRENIPPLHANGTWAKRPCEKATLLAETFAAKARLPEPAENKYSPVTSSAASLRGFLRIRPRDARKVLRDLDEASGTGPDLLPALILKKCAGELCLPVALLARLCLNEDRTSSEGNSRPR